MHKFILLSVLILCGLSCATMYKPEVWDDMTDQEVHTLRLYTGSMGESLYDTNFQVMAKDVCKGKGYDVIEKTKTPKTLHPKLHSDGYFNWIVRCK